LEESSGGLAIENDIVAKALSRAINAQSIPHLIRWAFSADLLQQSEIPTRPRSAGSINFKKSAKPAKVDL